MIETSTQIDAKSGNCAPGSIPPKQATNPWLRTHENRASRDAKVMIVDDERVNIEIVKAYLEEEGFENFIATTDSTKAIGMLRQLNPDIVLLDIKMPKVSGLEILETMRCDHDLMMTPAIVLTAANDPELKLQALRLGASDFLGKPVDPSELMLRFENVLAAKAYQDHLAKYSEKLENQVRMRTQELVRSRQEAIHCLLMLDRDFIAPSINANELDPNVEGMPLVTELIENAGIQTAMTNSFGFGGTNGTLVFQKL